MKIFLLASGFEFASIFLVFGFSESAEVAELRSRREKWPESNWRVVAYQKIPCILLVASSFAVSS